MLTAFLNITGIKKCVWSLVLSIFLVINQSHSDLIVRTSPKPFPKRPRTVFALIMSETASRPPAIRK